jgi:diphthine-ammonia ligase
MIQISSSQANTERQENIPPFFVAEVESLPRSSSIEWAAFSGVVTHGPITLSATTSSRLGRTYTCRVGDVMEEVVVMLPWLREDGGSEGGGGWKEGLRGRLWGLVGERMGRGRIGGAEAEAEAEGEEEGDEAGYCGADSAWLDVSVRELWEAEDGKQSMDWTGVVPCWSLWDGDGERLSAVLRFRYDLTGQ